MQICNIRYLLILGLIFSLMMPTFGLPQSSSSRYSYYQQDLPSNIRPYIDHIDFDPINAYGKGVRLYFNGVPPMSGKVSEDIAKFIVNSPVWQGSRNAYDVSNEINVHWSMAEHEIDRPEETRPNAISPIHLEYNKNDQSPVQQSIFNIGGPTTGFIANTVRFLDNRKPVEENTNNGVVSSSKNNPLSWQDKSISYPWLNSGTSSSVTGQSTPISTGQFSVGSKVETTAGLHVRSVPSLSEDASKIPTMPTGSTGTILAGPISADGFTWWRIKYDDGKIGWSEDKRLELASANQQPAIEPASQLTGKTLMVISADTPTYYPPGATSNSNGPIKLGSSAKNQQTVTPLVEQQTSSLVTNPHEYNPTTGSNSFSGGPGPGQVQVDITVKEMEGLDAIPGAQVTALDGNDHPAMVIWDSSSHAIAYGAPGDWKIIASAPKHLTNTAYVPAQTSTRSDFWLPKGDSSTQPQVSSPTINQPVTTSNADQISSSASSNGQVLAKFVIPPGGQITGTDGAGRTFQATADDNGYVTIPGSPGSWKLTASSPGYETLTINDYHCSGSEVYGGSGYVNLGLQKDETENKGSEQGVAYFSVQKGGVVGPVLVPGATITVQDGSGKTIQQQVDNNGHATIAGTSGLWQYAITAPGYATQKGYLSVSSGSTTSSNVNLQTDESGQSNSEPVSFAPVQNQVTVKFQVAPGTMITGTDGAGSGFQKTADENSYITITASPGNWQWTASAPGYVTSGPFSYLFTTDGDMSLPQTKDTSNQPSSENTPPIDQSAPQQAIQQPNLSSADSQPATSVQEGGLSQEQKDDILINQLESGTKGKDLSEEEANDLMNQLDEHQKQLDQQPATQPSEPASGDNQPPVDQQPAPDNATAG